MLKFSGFADLTSCLGGRAARSKPKRFPRATHTRRAQLTAHQKVFVRLLTERVPQNYRHQTSDSPKDSKHLMHRHAHS